jgi:alpha-ribazole phosphatase CobZ
MNNIKKLDTSLASFGITRGSIIDAAMELFIPAPKFDKKKARKIFEEELERALGDANVRVLLYAGILLEKEGRNGKLPVDRDLYKQDSVAIVADEVIGIALATYINGYKALFEYVRYDKKKPGILRRLGPFMDDAMAALIGGISSKVCDRICDETH